MIKLSDIENKETFVEKVVCEGWQKLRFHELDEDMARFLMTATLNKLEDFEDGQMKELKECGVFKILKGRMQYLGYELSDSAVTFIIMWSCRPGTLVMAACYIAWKVRNRITGNRITLQDLCKLVFPWGFPSEEDLSSVWDAQKVADASLTSNAVDNINLCKSLVYEK